MTIHGDPWKRIEGRGHVAPPFIGETIKNGRVERRAVLSYTTLDAAIWAAQTDGSFNRIVNDQGTCAYTASGKPKGQQ